MWRVEGHEEVVEVGIINFLGTSKKKLFHLEKKKAENDVNQSHKYQIK